MVELMSRSTLVQLYETIKIKMLDSKHYDFQLYSR